MMINRLFNSSEVWLALGLLALSLSFAVERYAPAGVRRPLAQAWRWLLITPSVLMVFALLFAIFGYIPGVQNMEQVLNITLSIVGVSLGLFLVAFVAGFAYDIERSTEHETGQNSMKEAPMSASILVAYATSSGSTQEVAEVVAATLSDEGFAVDHPRLGEQPAGAATACLVTLTSGVANGEISKK